MSDIESNLQWRRYYYRLGLFITQFSFFEAALFLALCKVAGIKQGMGQALFSGARADALLTLIRRAHEARGLPIKPWLDRALQQAALINGVRNDLVHLIISKESPGFTLTSEFRKMSGRAKSVTVTLETIEALCDDLLTIFDAMCLAAKTLNPEGKARWRKLLESAQKPWRYKPPEQESSRQTRRGDHSKRKRPPESSPA